MAPAKSTALAAAPAPFRGSALQIQTVEDLARVAEIMFKGGITPPGMTNPHTLAAVILAGLEVGLCPTQAVGSIMLTNGRLSIYGDAALALVRASGLLVSISEEVSGEGDARRCVCKVTRKGETERAFSFSMGEARQAGLIERAKGKDGKGGGPWVTYPDRMLTFRSRGYALRDVFPDVLRGLAMQEVEADEVPATRVVQATQATAAEVVTESGEVKQLGTAAVTEPAAATGQSVATAPATQQEPPADPNGPVGVDQLSEIKFIKERWATAIGAVEPEQQAAKWSELLGTYHVKSAREFTRATAATFIEVEGKKYDPFGHPSTASQT